MDQAAANSTVEEDSVSCIGQGLVSIYQVPELQQLTGIRSLCLHGNNLPRIEGIAHLSLLQDLNLSSNSITSISGLNALTGLTSLNLASNKLTAVAGLEGLSNLASLNLSYNYISNVSGLSALQGPLCKLRVLNLKHNQLLSLQNLAVLVGCINLKELHIQGNPVCAMPNHLQALMSVLPQVTQLDGQSAGQVMAEPYDAQMSQNYAAVQLYAFEQHQGQMHAPPHAAHAGPSTSYGSMLPADTPPNPRQLQPYQQQPAQGREQPGGYSSGGMQQFNHPYAQQGPAPHNQQSAQHAGPTVQAGHAMPTYEQAGAHSVMPQAQAQPRAPANWNAGGRRSKDAECMQATPEQPAAVQQEQAKQVSEPASYQAAPRPPAVDAASQTNDYTPALRKLQLEAAELRLQLSKVTGEDA